MQTINHIQVNKKHYNGADYFKITSPGFDEIESNWETKSIIDDVIENWKANILLGSFGIGFILAENALIEWKG